MLDILPTGVLLHICGHLWADDINRLRRVNGVLRSRIYHHRPAITRMGTNTRRAVFSMDYDLFFRPMHRYSRKPAYYHYSPVGVHHKNKPIIHALQVQFYTIRIPLIIQTNAALSHFIRVEGIVSVYKVGILVTPSNAMAQALSTIPRITQLTLGQGIDRRERCVLPGVHNLLFTHGDPLVLELPLIQHMPNLTFWQIGKHPTTATFQCLHSLMAFR